MFHSALFTHSFSGVVAVASSTIPVAAGDGFGVEGDFDAPLFSDTDEEETSHPEVVPHGDTLARADLELPLGGHDLGVDAADVDTGKEASAVVGLDQVTSDHFASTNTAVLRALWSWETTLGPSEGLVIGIKETVLLLETEPRLMLFGLVHDLLGMVAVVGPVGGAVVVIAFSENEDVVAASERILEDGSRAEVYI